MDSCTKADYHEVESIHNRAELLKALKETIIGKKAKFDETTDSFARHHLSIQGR